MSINILTSKTVDNQCSVTSSKPNGFASLYNNIVVTHCSNPTLLLQPLYPYNSFFPRFLHSKTVSTGNQSLWQAPYHLKNLNMGLLYS